MNLTMDPSTRQNVVNLLTGYYQMRPQGGGERYKYGLCPSCGKKELWAWGDNPWTVQCDREGKCGYHARIRDLHPDLFKSYAERFDSDSDAEPQAAARAYLKEKRGLDPMQAGPFKQETYRRGTVATPTIRFQLLSGTWWERLIDDHPDFGAMKARFEPNASYAGYGWLPPSFDAKKCKELWIVEGIFDALALQAEGVMALSAMSCHNFPEATLKAIYEENKTIRIIVALDSNEPGKKGIRQFVPKVRLIGFKDVGAALTNNHRDWNDCYLDSKFSPSDIRRYKYQGDLLLAEDHVEKAKLMWQHLNRSDFYFEYGTFTYWFSINLNTYNDEYTQALKRDGIEEESLLSEAQIKKYEYEAFTRSNSLYPIANFIVDVLYIQMNIEESELFYFISLQSERDTVKDAFTGKQLMNATDFRNKVASTLGGAIYKGGKPELDAIYEEKTRYIKRVDTIRYVGYCPENQVYIYPELAVHNGNIYEANEEEYFEVGKMNVKTIFRLTKFNPITEFNDHWVEDFIYSYQERGLIALTFWFGSLFAVQVRKKYGFYPFLEITGDAGAGKSSMIYFLWSLLGREQYEGFNPSTSTYANVTRNFNQVSNMPVVLNEGDTQKDSKKGAFNFETLKDLYNGNSPRGRGLNTSGYETDEEPFLGSVVIAQNDKIQASEAILSRLIYLHFTKGNHDDEGRMRARRLSDMRSDEIGGFLIHAIKHETSILEIVFERFDRYTQSILDSGKVEMVRIAENHGLMMAFMDALATVLPISSTEVKKVHRYLQEIAVERQIDLKQDHPILEQFWDLYDDLTINPMNRINHNALNDPEIALNLNDFYAIARRGGYELPDMTMVRRLIQNSVRYEYVTNKTVRSVHKDVGTKRCFVFRKRDKSEK